MLLALLQRHAAEQPDGVAIIEADGTTWRFDELVLRAQGVAAAFVAQPADRVAVQTTSVPALIAILAGAAHAGVEACVLAPDLEAGVLERRVERFGFDRVVSSIEELAGDPTSCPDAAERSPLLVLTTGTTGEPKGARHDWQRLLAPSKDRRPEPGTRWLLAYNLHQFAGIQILVHVLSVGGALVVPLSNRPADAAETLVRHGVTHASATPTFWRFLLAQLGRDRTQAPTQLRQITLGGEAVNAAVLADLRATFPDARISHIYASTEFGSAVSVRDEGIGLPASILERSDDDDVRFKIVDGELWVSSRVGMLGYAGDGTGDDTDVSDDWRATGDLVAIEGDRIVFMGRTSEIINVGGVKVHPLPIEELVLQVDGVQLARVFGRDNPISGQIVAVDVVIDDDADEDKVIDSIRDACEVLPPASRPRRVKVVPTLEIRGGKVARS